MLALRILPRCLASLTGSLLLSYLSSGITSYQAYLDYEGPALDGLMH